MICSEGLSTPIKLAIQEETLNGVRVSRRGPQITHLLFADDCVLFAEATSKGANTLQQIQNEYEVCSGQCINYEKSSVFFSKNTLACDRNIVSGLLGIRPSNETEKYLGLLSVVERNKKLVFQIIKDRMW